MDFIGIKLHNTNVRCYLSFDIIDGFVQCLRFSRENNKRLKKAEKGQAKRDYAIGEAVHVGLCWYESAFPRQGSIYSVCGLSLK